MPAVDVRPVTPGRWDDVVDLFERKGPYGGTPQTDGCWCQFWHLRGNAYWDGHGARNRARLEAEIRNGAEPGLLAYVDDVPVGWCRVGPRETFERLEHSVKLARVDDQDTWAVVCFYVHPSAKRNGVASALLDAAVARATAHGAWRTDARGLPSSGRAYEHRLVYGIPPDAPRGRLRGHTPSRTANDRQTEA
jgi:GNAT superfamily N-acetyltransferase